MVLDEAHRRACARGGGQAGNAAHFVSWPVHPRRSHRPRFRRDPVMTEPVPMGKAEAIATLRTVAALNGGFVARIYGGGRSPPLRVRALRGYAVIDPRP